KAKGEFEAPVPVPADVPKAFAVADSKIVDTPDRTRIESGLPIPTTQPGPGGVLVDKLVEVAPQPAPAQRKGTFQKAAPSQVKVAVTGLNPPEAPNGPGNA
ncbi:MAG TPA: hypothetical protein VGR71_03125, partial [Nitrospira sp.]|nr:hypothetical protein [Nitrospira sp.]